MQAPGLPASGPPEPAANPPRHQSSASATSWLSLLKRQFAPVQHGRIVDIGWTLRQTKASLIWEPPRPVMNKGPRPSHSKVVSVCPAMLDHRVPADRDHLSD